MRTTLAALLLLLSGCSGGASVDAPAPPLDPRSDLELRNALHDALQGDPDASARGRDFLIQAGARALPILSEALAEDTSLSDPGAAKAPAAERLRRRKIAFLLGEIRDPSAIPPLLEHYDGETYGRALSKITGAALGDDLPAWREWYVSQPPVDRDELARTLELFKRQGDRERLETMKGLAEATRLRTGAAMLEAMPSALSSGGVRQGQILKGADLDRRRAALCILPDALTDPDTEVRRYARMVALQLGHLSVATLRRLSLSSSLEGRAVAIYTLGEIGDPRALPELLQGLSSSEATLRARSAWSLGQIGSASALPPLEARLALEQDPFARAGILAALVECGQVDRFESLVSLLDDPGERDAAAAHLESICRRAFALGQHQKSGLHLPLNTVAWQAYWKDAALGHDPAKWRTWWTHPEGPARDVFVKPIPGDKP